MPDITRMSPGELRKLLLARGFLNRVVLIVLDEPTNHLDMPSRTAVTGALQAWPGVLLVQQECAISGGRLCIR